MHQRCKCSSRFAPFFASSMHLRFAPQVHCEGCEWNVRGALRRMWVKRAGCTAKDRTKAVRRCTEGALCKGNASKKSGTVRWWYEVRRTKNGTRVEQSGLKFHGVQKFFRCKTTVGLDWKIKKLVKQWGAKTTPREMLKVQSKKSYIRNWPMVPSGTNPSPHHFRNEVTGVYATTDSDLITWVN